MALIFILLFIVPFVVAPFGETFFETPKVLVTQAGILLLLSFTLFFKNPGLPKYAIGTYAILIIFGLTLIHLLFFRSDISFFGNATRLQGIFLLWCFLIFAYLSQFVSLQAISWKVFAFLIGLHGVALLFSPVSVDNRYVSFFGEPNAFAAYMLFLWPFLFFQIKKWGMLEKGILATAACIILIILFLTNSKSAMVGFSLQILFLILSKYVSSKKAIIICVFLYMCSYALPFLSQAPYENRVDVWQTAVISGAKSPLVGHGFGNTEITMSEVSKTTGNNLQDYYVDSAHNIFLDWWVQGGIIGLVSILVLTVSSLKTFLKKQMTQELVLLIGVITALSFNPASVVSLVGFWWLVGQGLKENK